MKQRLAHSVGAAVLALAAISLSSAPVHAQSASPDSLPVKLVARLDLSKFAPAGDFHRSAVQFGDLDGNGRHSDFVRTQNGSRIQAFAWDGKGEPKLLWSWTSPVIGTAPLPPDRYFYKSVIHDVDGDGKSEVIAAVAHESGKLELRVLDGLTGAVKAARMTSVDNPKNADPVKTTRVRLSVADLSGKGRPTEILFLTENDSKGDIFAFDASLAPLWDTTGDNDSKQRIYGHYLWHADLDGDGRQETIASYILGADGKRRARLTPGFWAPADLFYDHLDRVIVGDLDPARPGLEILYSYEFMKARLTDAQGREIWSKPLLNGDAKLAAAGEFRPDVPGTEVLAYDPDNKGKLHMFSIDGKELGTVSTPDGRFDGYVIQWDGDLRTDKVFQSQGAVVLDPATGRSVVLATHYLKDAQTATLRPNRVFGQAVDVTGDRREEIVLSDDDEILVYGADGPAVEGPSWWTKPAYRIAMANSMNDNHPERPHLDFRVLDGQPLQAAAAAKPASVGKAEVALKVDKGFDKEERRAVVFRNGNAQLALARAGRTLTRAADDPLAGNAMLAPPRGARQFYTFRTGNTAIMTFRMGGMDVQDVVDHIAKMLEGQGFAREAATTFATASEGPANLRMSGKLGELGFVVAPLKGKRDSFDIRIDLSKFGV